MSVCLVSAAHAGLATVGPIDPAHGYPEWYMDTNGLALELCLEPGGDCLLELPNPALPVSFPLNFPDEAFWWAAEAAMPTNNGGNALLVLAMEAAFANDAVVDGDQISFGRIRIRVGNLIAGANYTVTTPFGVFEFNNVAAGPVGINFSDDVGIQPGVFTGALSSGIGPFLVWDPAVPPAAPEGFVGNPAIEHTVIGSPFGTNFFRIEGPQVGGPSVNMIETNLFSVLGKIIIVCQPGDPDDDGDGVADECDNCPATVNPDQADLDEDRLGDACDPDIDGDGTLNESDLCPIDPGKIDPGICGCGVADTDTDADGTADCLDNCPEDANKLKPGVCGCGTADTDSDADGTPDCNDNCPNDAGKLMPGICGCGTPETDTDGDGTPDCVDSCPNDPAKSAPGACGCGTPETDTDGDGTPDCVDICPNDPAKSAPGACGCGTPETDTDADGTADCLDACPTDPAKTMPGVCGCGTPDADADGDGTLDCVDSCPNDPLKTLPGGCGCGAADTDSDNDGILDCNDNCPVIANPQQADGDGDGVGDACDSLLSLESCPDDLTVLADSPEGVAVDLGLPDANQGFGDVTITSDPPSGSVFPIGTTTVTITASDHAAKSITCVFDVTVLPPPGAPSAQPAPGCGPGLCGVGGAGMAPLMLLGLLKIRRSGSRRRRRQG